MVRLVYNGVYFFSLSHFFVKKRLQLLSLKNICRKMELLKLNQRFLVGQLENVLFKKLYISYSFKTQFSRKS